MTGAAPVTTGEVCLGVASMMVVLAIAMFWEHRHMAPVRWAFWLQLILGPCVLVFGAGGSKMAGAPLWFSRAMVLVAVLPTVLAGLYIVTRPKPQDDDEDDETTEPYWDRAD